VQPDDHARKRPVISSATASLIRHPRTVMHRRFSWRDVPLPTRAFAAWHGEWSFPLLAVRRSWGFKSPFAGLIPPTGDRSSLPDRAHVPLRPIHAPINFRRVRFAAASENESSNWRRIARAVGLASGLRLPSAVRISRRLWARSRHHALETVPALGFASCRVDGHVICASVRARPRPDHLTWIGVANDPCHRWCRLPLVGLHPFEQQARRGLPFSVLQARCLAPPSHFHWPGRAPCLRFCTIRERDEFI
jgi:hypothetical protein